MPKGKADKPSEVKLGVLSSMKGPVRMTLTVGILVVEFVGGDTDDLEGAVAEEQPRWPAAAPVAGEVEPGPVAACRPQAERVRHAHSSAASLASFQPDHRRRRR